MNLVNMSERGDRNLILSSLVRPAKRKIDNIQYRGFDISPSDTPQILIKNVFNWYPFCERTEVTGWLVSTLDKKAEGNYLEVELQDHHGSMIAAKKVYLSSKPSPVTFPSSLTNCLTSDQYSLVLRLPNSAVGRVFFIVYKVLERSDILSLCQGRGVEIGPGTNPQVLPSTKIDITYIEQSSPEQWNTLYNDTGKYPVNPKLWSRYQIGEAHSLPVPDGSLDFIFSSHVFEHLANPLGHLQYWHSKLKAGGLILAVVPDVAGCKDYVYRPCPLNNILQEYQQGIMEPNFEHYNRWAKYRAPGQDPKLFYEAKRSIHVHFYTNRNMAELLSYAVEHLGYSWFNIRHTPNHKDFYFVLAKA
ncbi:methyltransferase domain-containing protein [Calothrix sp. PCC 7507]|uniref:methyltransferase domain-containing protein n=1 Tax=Calothrix sp. PCC 7507 TaxID=99598 RepID=UPI00029EEC48|nr:methyltransferase domain-containing protein [Calothrix sp. PCC 7507]AFY35629.1 Methyltransferase type 11 [Calothrix sp. PCC 7507]